MKKVSRKKTDVIEMWRPWFRIVDRGRVEAALAITPKPYKELIAILLSMAKWHPQRFRERSLNYFAKITRINNCGLCLYHNPKTPFTCLSTECVLMKRGKNCANITSAYREDMSNVRMMNPPKVIFKLLEPEYKQRYEEFEDVINEHRENVMCSHIKGNRYGKRS